MTIDQGLKARELLAAEIGCLEVDLRLYWHGSEAEFQAALRAIEAALSSTPSPSLPSREAIEEAIWRETYLHDTLLYWVEIKPGTMHHKRVRAAADAILSLLPVNGTRVIAVEKDAIARELGAVLPVDIDWQHIRAASQAFVDKLAALSLPVNGWREGVEAAELDLALEAADEFELRASISQSVALSVRSIVFSDRAEKYETLYEAEAERLLRFAKVIRAMWRALSAAPGEGAAT